MVAYCFVKMASRFRHCYGCLERHDVTDRNGRAHAMHTEASALRPDIQKAPFLIDWLQRR